VVLNDVISFSSNNMNPEQNKLNAIAFYKTAFEGNPELAVELYVGEEYIQHNPVVKDGKAGFIEYFLRLGREYPQKSIRFVRAVAENDLVALHTHQLWPDNEEWVTMDFFRFNARGKIIEHWDTIQKVPETSVNHNTIY
jgi:predicted SnoaL-like aldol condensation-catalyzing enzyme